MNLLEQSKHWHNNAIALLKASHIIKFLEQYGEVSFSGSYAYNLMLDSDIDIFIANKRPSRKLADEIAISLIRSGHWTSLMYCDWPTNDPAGAVFLYKA